MKTNRQGGNKKTKELDDIGKAIQALQINNKMPLVIASSGMMGRCPSSWGQPENPSCQDIMGKFQMVEEILSNFMDQQKRQMDILNNEVASIKLAGPKASMINSSCFTLSATPSFIAMLSKSSRSVLRHLYLFASNDVRSITGNEYSATY